MKDEDVTFTWRHLIDRHSMLRAQAAYTGWRGQLVYEEPENTPAPVLYLPEDPRDADYRVIGWLRDYLGLENVTDDGEIARARAAIDEATRLADETDDWDRPDEVSLVSLPDSGDTHAYVQVWMLVEIGLCCRACHTMYPEGEDGRDGMCGNCADRAQNYAESRWQPVGRGGLREGDDFITEIGGEIHTHPATDVVVPPQVMRRVLPEEGTEPRHG